MIDTTNGNCIDVISDGWGGYPGGGSVWTENGSVFTMIQVMWV